MSNFRTVTDRVSVAPQISKGDIDAAAANGVTLIVNNRPDGEEMNQPTNAELAAYANEKGVNWQHIPVVSGELTVQAIQELADAMAENKGKILAYCRSGTRSCTLWGLAAAFTGGTTTENIIAKASAAGYDLSGFQPTLDTLQGKRGG